MEREQFLKAVDSLRRQGKSIRAIATDLGVNPVGSGSIVAAFPGDPGPTPPSFVLVDNMKEIRLIRTDLGVASGVAKRQ